MGVVFATLYLRSGNLWLVAGILFRSPGAPGPIWDALRVSLAAAWLIAARMRASRGGSPPAPAHGA